MFDRFLAETLGETSRCRGAQLPLYAPHAQGDPSSIDLLFPLSSCNATYKDGMVQYARTLFDLGLCPSTNHQRCAILFSIA